MKWEHRGKKEKGKERTEKELPTKNSKCNPFLNKFLLSEHEKATRRKLFYTYEQLFFQRSEECKVGEFATVILRRVINKTAKERNGGLAR